MKTYGKPNRTTYGGDVRVWSSVRHRSCWDCEHIQVGSQPFRTCPVHPTENIWAADADTEAFEEEDSGRKGTLADRCKDFMVAKELDGALLPMFEAEA